MRQKYTVVLSLVAVALIATALFLFFRQGGSEGSSQVVRDQGPAAVSVEESHSAQQSVGETMEPEYAEATVSPTQVERPQMGSSPPPSQTDNGSPGEAPEFGAPDVTGPGPGEDGSMADGLAPEAGIPQTNGSAPEASDAGEMGPAPEDSQPLTGR